MSLIKGDPSFYRLRWCYVTNNIPYASADGGNDVDPGDWISVYPHVSAFSCGVADRTQIRRTAVEGSSFRYQQRTLFINTSL